MREVVTWGPAGVKVLDSAKLTRAQAGMVAEVGETVTEHGGSKRGKFYSAPDAIMALAKLLGYLAKDAAAPPAEFDPDQITFDMMTRAYLRMKAEGLVPERPPLKSMPLP